MRDRLEIIRRLLAKDGSLWITIDDNEAHYLKVLLRRGFWAIQFCFQRDLAEKVLPSNDAKWISNSHDHVLCYLG